MNDNTWQRSHKQEEMTYMRFDTIQRQLLQRQDGVVCGGNS